jgi:hypothetical protein
VSRPDHGSGLNENLNATGDGHHDALGDDGATDGSTSADSASRRRSRGRRGITMRPPEAQRRELVTGDEVIGECSGDAEQLGRLGDREHQPFGAVHQRHLRARRIFHCED